MALNKFKNALIGSFLAVGAVVAPTSGYTQEPAAFTTISVSQLPHATEAEATQQSINGVLLHVGEGFNENTLQAVVDWLEHNDYIASVYLGGTEEHIDLFINGRKGGKPFDTRAAISIMPRLIEKYAPEGAKVASSGEEPIPDQT